MKPLNSGLGLTGNEGIPGALLMDEKEEKSVPKKNRKMTKSQRDAVKNAAPKDVFCLAWIASASVEDCVKELHKKGYSSSENSAVARAARIRKAKRNPLDLPVLEGERSKRDENWDDVLEALRARQSGDGGTLAIANLENITD